jgi:hypothetical protein
MADRNDYLKVESANMLKVSPKQDSHQNPFEENEKKKKKHTEQEQLEVIKNQHQIKEYDPTELIELGRLILNKRNFELKLFLRLKGKEKLITSKDFVHKTLETDIILLQQKIAEYDINISELDLKVKVDNSKQQDIEEELSKLGKLKTYYQLFFDFVKEEKNILNIDNIDFLDEIIQQKDIVLKQIIEIQKTINFEIFKEILPENEKKIKANQILSDIHYMMNEIIRQEDENSVELHSLMEKMKLDIARQDKGAKAISQYGQSSLKSHFIDTKK